MIREDALRNARELRKEITACQVRLTTLINLVAQLPDDGAGDNKCPTCGIKARGPLSLAEHIHTSHDGPIPAAWLEAERKAGIEQPAGHMMGTE